jgi:hypothetical protein
MSNFAVARIAPPAPAIDCVSPQTSESDFSNLPQSFVSTGFPQLSLSMIVNFSMRHLGLNRFHPEMLTNCHGCHNCWFLSQERRRRTWLTPFSPAPSLIVSTRQNWVIDSSSLVTKRSRRSSVPGKSSVADSNAVSTVSEA